MCENHFQDVRRAADVREWWGGLSSVLPWQRSTFPCIPPPLHKGQPGGRWLGKQSLFVALALILCEIWHGSLTFTELCFLLYKKELTKWNLCQECRVGSTYEKRYTTLLIKPHDHLNTEKAPNKIRHCFLMKNPATNSGIEPNFLKLIKGIYS